MRPSRASSQRRETIIVEQGARSAEQNSLPAPCSVRIVLETVHQNRRTAEYPECRAAASRSAADLALHIHLGGRLRERKVRGPEAHLGLRREEPARPSGQRRFEVDEANPFIHREPFDLLEDG